MKTFAKFAKERIVRLGKSQNRLAADLGVSPAYISQVINGKKNPPDLSKPGRRNQLRVWCEFLDATEDDLLGIVRFQLHRIPPRPEPRYMLMRELLMSRIDLAGAKLRDEIRSMELHPIESIALQKLVQAYFILQEDLGSIGAYGPVRFKDFCTRAKMDREFVEAELWEFYRNEDFLWHWDEELGDALIRPVSSRIREAFARLARVFDHEPSGLNWTIPVVGHVSAGEGFAYTDGGFGAGEGFDHVDVPPGVDSAVAKNLYCVRVRGDSLREFFGDGALLFIKPESWEEIRDGDLVIFKDRKDKKAFVKKVEFSGENLILKSMNSMYKNMVVHKQEVILLERVMAIVL